MGGWGGGLGLGATVTGAKAPIGNGAAGPWMVWGGSGCVPALHRNRDPPEIEACVAAGSKPTIRLTHEPRGLRSCLLKTYH